MTKWVVLAALFAVFSAPTLRADALSDLTARVQNLEERLSKYELQQAGAFTCAASCVLWEQGYQDKTYTVTASGPDRLTAFKALGAECVRGNTPNYANWYLKNPRTGGSALATERDICLKD